MTFLHFFSTRFKMFIMSEAHGIISVSLVCLHSLLLLVVGWGLRGRGVRIVKTDRLPHWSSKSAAVDEMLVKMCGRSLSVHRVCLSISWQYWLSISLPFCTSAGFIFLKVEEGCLKIQACVYEVRVRMYGTDAQHHWAWRQHFHICL